MALLNNKQFLKSLTKSQGEATSDTETGSVHRQLIWQGKNQHTEEGLLIFLSFKSCSVLKLQEL